MEQGIIEKLRKGDREAFRWLFNKHHNIVYTAAVGILRNSADAEDIVQETFLQAFRTIRSYDPTKSSLERWIYVIASREALKRAEVTTRRPELKQEQPVTKKDISLEDYLKSAMNELSARHRTLIVLRFYSNMNIDKIAETLAIPLGNVKLGLNLAFHKLRQILGSRLKLPFEPEKL